MIRELGLFTRIVEKYGLSMSEQRMVKEALVNSETEEQFVKLLKEADQGGYLCNERCTPQELYRDLTEEESKTTKAGMYAKDVLNRDEVKEIDEGIRPILKHFANSYWLAGSYRRGKKIVGDVDYVVTDANLKNILAGMMQTFKVLEVSRQGSSVMTVVIRHGRKEAQVEFLNVKDSEFGSALLHSTGSGDFNQGLRSFAKGKGLILNQHGLFVVTSKQKLASKSEEDVFKALGFEFIPPEERDTPFYQLKKKYLVDKNKNAITFKPKVEGGKTWTVRSRSNPKVKRYVMLSPTGKWSCTCPDNRFRKAICHHIQKVQKEKGYV